MILVRLTLTYAGLVGLASAFYVVASYVHAFFHRRAPRAHLVRAGFIEFCAALLVLSLYPLWWLIGRSYEAAEEGAGEARGRCHPVVLLHGFAMNRTSWVWLGNRLARRGIGPLYGKTYFSLQSVRRSAEELARFVDEVAAIEGAARVDIVAHSLGGIVARYYIERLGGHASVGRLVTIGTPHRGSVFGRLGFYIPSARDSLPGSGLLPWPPEPGPVQYASIWSRADAIVEPAESASIAPAGVDCVFDDLGHLSLLLSRRVIERVAHYLVQDSRAG